MVNDVIDESVQSVSAQNRKWRVLQSCFSFFVLARGVGNLFAEFRRENRVARVQGPEKCDLMVKHGRVAKWTSLFDVTLLRHPVESTNCVIICWRVTNEWSSKEHKVSAGSKRAWVSSFGTDDGHNNNKNTVEETEVENQNKNIQEDEGETQFVLSKTARALSESRWFWVALRYFSQESDSDFRSLVMLEPLLQFSCECGFELTRWWNRPAAVTVTSVAHNWN